MNTGFKKLNDRFEAYNTYKLMSHLHTFILFSRIHRFIYILYTFGGGDICFTGFSNITLKEYVYLRPWYTLLSHDDSIGFGTATADL